MFSTTALRLVDAALDIHLPKVTESRGFEEALTFQRGLKTFLAAEDERDHASPTAPGRLHSRALTARISAMIAKARREQLAQAGFSASSETSLAI